MIYSKEAVEFVTVAAEYIRFLESAGKYKKDQFLSISQKLLPLLYLKSALIPEITPILEEDPEKYVTEADWTLIKNEVSRILGDDDIWMIVNEPLMTQEDEGISVCVSECYADIYQDLSDFIQAYRIGNESIMNDALFVCRQNFEQYWGGRLLATLMAIHQNVYGKDFTNEI